MDEGLSESFQLSRSLHARSLYPQSFKASIFNPHCCSYERASLGLCPRPRSPPVAGCHSVGGWSQITCPLIRVITHPSILLHLLLANFALIGSHSYLLLSLSRGSEIGDRGQRRSGRMDDFPNLAKIHRSPLPVGSSAMDCHIEDAESTIGFV